MLTCPTLRCPQAVNSPAPCSIPSNVRPSSPLASGLRPSVSGACGRLTRRSASHWLRQRGHFCSACYVKHRKFWQFGQGILLPFIRAPRTRRLQVSSLLRGRREAVGQTAAVQSRRKPFGFCCLGIFMSSYQRACAAPFYPSPDWPLAASPRPLRGERAASDWALRAVFRGWFWSQTDDTLPSREPDTF